MKKEVRRQIERLVVSTVRYTRRELQKENAEGNNERDREWR